MVVRRFDVYPNPSRTSSRTIPYLLVVQSDLLDEMDTCVVLPLARADAARHAAGERLNPRLRIEEEDVVVLTQLIAAVPMASLRSRASHLDTGHDTILRALDFFFSGI
jgi:toxin CcdB